MAQPATVLPVLPNWLSASYMSPSGEVGGGQTVAPPERQGTALVLNMHFKDLCINFVWGF